ncbi:MAG TPA: hypothetical protein VLF18_21325 [Tahibacter sp.]|uniref:hypothetical protein n=1 Tax=Tahibacter sp. TaxID=2056211 RepID=UPI002BE69380|nr:hypothetical protein [Tahibacter sp.]HSX62732.1 hypothetical protein [Tahibacter sp.]
MTLLLLLFLVFAAAIVFIVLVVGLMLLMAVGTTYAIPVAVALYLGLSALGGFALSAVSRSVLKESPWSWAAASLVLALAAAAELGLAFVSGLI